MEIKVTKDNTLNHYNESVVINLENKGSITVKPGSTPLYILELTGRRHDRTLIMGIYNGRRIDLRAPLKEDGNLSFCQLKSPEGIEAFRRGITMLISYLILEINPKARLVVQHSLNRGLYCEFSNLTAGLRPAIAWLRTRLKALVSEDIPFIYRKVSPKEAIAIFEAQNEPEKNQLHAL